MKNIRLLIIVSGILFSGLFFNSCTHEIVPALKVIKRNSNAVNSNQGINYSLPINGFRIYVEMEKQYHFVGPFFKYAEKYLGISKGIIYNDEIFYSICSVQIVPFSVPDPEQSYILKDSNCIVSMVSLSPEGFLKGFNLPSLTEDTLNRIIQSYIPQDESSGFIFTDLSTKRFFGEKSEVSGKKVKQDSVFIKVPIYSHDDVGKSPELKAEEAANFIFKLRKRRFKLQTGMSDQQVASGNMPYMSAALDSLEARYIELFIGKSLSESETATFEYIPGKSLSDSVLFYFSTTRGISFTPDNNPKNIKREAPLYPVVLSLKSHPAISDSLCPEPTLDKGIPYRIPARLDITLTRTNKILASGSFLVAQLGTIAYLPKKYVLTPGFVVEFYPETGALKRIAHAGN